ncbi:MAG: hypothetical protein AB8B55_15360 [Mariniblastus sp.]
MIIHELIDRLPDKFEKPQVDGTSDQNDSVKDSVETNQPNLQSENAQGKNLSVDELMKAALDEPLFYPKLQESVFAGDTVGIALQSNLPHPKLILEALLKQLNSANVDPADIVVVVSPRTARRLEIDPSLYEITDEQKTSGERPGVFPVEFGFNSINFQVHDPEIETGLAYIIANAAGEPVHINRMLVDADVVLPVSCPVAGEANQQIDCLYPEFASEVIKGRFADGKGSFLSRWEEIEIANDTLGSFFSIQIICGPGDKIERVICGARKDATDAARLATNELWAFQWEGQADVTVATIEMEETDQTWDDFAHALITASRLSTPDAPIVICSEIAVMPDRNIRKALLSQFETGISGKLTKTMQHVAAIVNERPVFLHSKLKSNSIEELGIGFIETIDEVLRIAEPHEQGLLIRDAHRCQVKADSNANDNSTDREVLKDA